MYGYQGGAGSMMTRQQSYPPSSINNNITTGAATTHLPPNQQSMAWQQQQYQQQPVMVQRFPQHLQQQQQPPQGVAYHQGVLLRNALSNTMPSPPPTPPASSGAAPATACVQNVMFSLPSHSQQPSYPSHQHGNIMQPHQQQIVYNSQARLQHYRNMQQNIHMNGGVCNTDGVVPTHGYTSHRPSPPPYDMHNKPRLPIPSQISCNNNINMNTNNNNIIAMKPCTENNSGMHNNITMGQQQQQRCVYSSGDSKMVPVPGAMSETVMMSPTSLCSTPNDIDDRLLDGCDKLSAMSHQALVGIGVSCFTGEDEEAILDYYTHLAMELGVHLLKELPELDDVDIMCS